MANYELSNRIYELRTQKGLSQKELGAILGVSNKAVSKWETGTAIPKIETLIKLAEVFEISTEELLNTVCKEEDKQQIFDDNSLSIQQSVKEENSMFNINIPENTNAIIGKTLAEFRAEKGLYLKDVAEKIGVDESELQTIEESGLVPDEIANKLVVAYGLLINDFAKPVAKSPKEAKKYFLKVSIIFEIILAFIATVPIAIGSILIAIGTFCDSDILLDISEFTADISLFWSAIVAVVGSIKLGDYLTKKSGYLGDFNKHKFLYFVVPRSALLFITTLSTTILLLGSNDIQGVSYWISNGFNLLLSLLSTILIVFIMSTLMNISVEQNPERTRKMFKKIAIVVTISVLVAYVLDGVNDYIIFGIYNGISPIQDFLFCVLDIAIVWLVYSIKESNPKREKIAFTILPIISIWEFLISDIITLVL